MLCGFSPTANKEVALRNEHINIALSLYKCITKPNIKRVVTVFRRIGMHAIPLLYYYRITDI